MDAHLLALILAALAGQPSEAHAHSARPVAAQQVFRCDFEEAADHDFDGWPDRWTRRRGPGLPEFVRIGIVEDKAVDEKVAGPVDAKTPPPKTINHSLRIDLDGGGACAVAPEVAINQQFSFVVTARIKTQGLKEDAAWVELALLDASGATLQTFESPRISGTSAWQTVQIGPILSAHPQATKASLALRLAPVGSREDLTGSAEFDDLHLAHLPRMMLKANQPGHLYEAGDAVHVFCEVSGIPESSPAVTFELLDHAGRTLAQREERLVANTRGGTKSGVFSGNATWQPPLAEFGLYRVRASLAAAEKQTLLERTITLARLRPLTTADRGEFGWTLRSEDEPLPAGQLARLLGGVGLHWVKLPVWFDAAQTARGENIASFAEQVSLHGIELVGVLDQPPAELRDAFREKGRLPVASVFIEPELWGPTVSPVMTRLSLKVRWWQLGDDADASYIGFPQLTAKVAEIKKQLEQFGQEVRLGIGWRWMYAPPQVGQNAGSAAPWTYLSYQCDPPLTADELGAYLSAPPPPSDAKTAKNAASASGQRWLVLAPLSAAEYSLPARVRDLVGRMVAAKIHKADAVFVPEPFHNDHGLMQADGTPGDLLLPWRTTARLLAGAEYLGQIQLPGGSTNHVFARNGQAVLVISSDEPTHETLCLGDTVEVIDLWGRTVQPVAAQQDGVPVQQIEVGPLPVFVTGLSEAVARWQIALTFDDPWLAGLFGREQMIKLSLRNTFPQGIGGEVTLHVPPSWSVDGRPLRFKVSDGEKLQLPIPVTLQPDANSGPQPVRLDFDLSSDRNYRFSVHRTLQLGLQDVQIELSTKLREDGALIVEQQTTNLADRPVSFRCTLFPPGRRRETRQVLDQERGRSTLTFVLPGGEELLGQKLWLRAEEIGGPRVLNSTVTAER